jgi:hypothetical protein
MAVHRERPSVEPVLPNEVGERFTAFEASEEAPASLPAAAPAPAAPAPEPGPQIPPAEDAPRGLTARPRVERTLAVLQQLASLNSDIIRLCELLPRLAHTQRPIS